MSVDYFLKIDGIKGESTKDKHKDEIELKSFSWGEANAGSHAGNAGGGSGKVDMQDFHFVMPTNKASPMLFLHCANGKHLKEALLTCRKQGEKQQEYLKIKFSDLLVSSFQVGGSEGNVVPTEQISFNFTKIVFTYSPQKPDGTLDSPIETGWDLKTGIKL